jgi:hypothetical protein
MNDKFEWMCGIFQCPTSIFAWKETGKWQKYSCQDSKFLGKVLKLLPPKEKTELWFMKKMSNIQSLKAH